MTSSADPSPTPIEDAATCDAADRLAAAPAGDTYQPSRDEQPARRVRRSARRMAIPLLLFVLTCGSTFFAGACRWAPSEVMFTPQSHPLAMFPVRQSLYRHWDEGLIYMAAVLAILLTHEMGHFLATVIYRIPASLPFCIPFPLSPFGTLGAVIGMQGMRADRKQMFDIGLGGPLAGLLVAAPVTWIGVQQLDFTQPAHGLFQIDLPLALRWLLELVRPAGYTGQDFIWQSHLNPWLMAGWVGCFVTALNMLPISQLDGGHVTYTMFGRGAHWLARIFFVAAVASWGLGLVSRLLWLMLVLPLFIGIDHPPTRNDQAPLGLTRYLVGALSLAIPILCFPPRCILFYDS